MASLVEEANALMKRANELISDEMNTGILDAARTYLSYSVHQNVYPLYNPGAPSLDDDEIDLGTSQYIRRKNSGGLSDWRMYDVIYDDSDGDIHQIDIMDDRHEVGVVESGEGYTWVNSRIYKMQPFPRPYFSKADEMIQDNQGVFESMLLGVLSGL